MPNAEVQILAHRLRMFFIAENVSSMQYVLACILLTQLGQDDELCSLVFAAVGDG